MSGAIMSPGKIEELNKKGKLSNDSMKKAAGVLAANAELDSGTEEMGTEEEAEQFAKDTPEASSTVATGAFRTIEEIEADLSKPIPKKYIKVLDKGPAKGSKYVSYLVVQRALSKYAPGWETTTPVMISTPVGVAVVVHLTIPTATGKVTRAGHGFEAHQTKNYQGEIKDTGFGGAAVVASAQAFKRAAVAFGFARDLYPA